MIWLLASSLTSSSGPSLLQPHGPPSFCSSDTPSSFLPQGLCPCGLLCRECSSFRSTTTGPSCHSMLGANVTRQNPPLRILSKEAPPQAHQWSFPQCLVLFMSCHLLLQLLLELSLDCLPSLECKLLEGRGLISFYYCLLSV